MEGTTVRGLKETIRRLPQHPLGDGHTYAELPDGTSIVSMADGSYRLALPVRLSVDFRGNLDGSLTLSPEVKKKPPATEDDEVDEGAVARDAWRISPAAGLLAAEAIQKAANIDEARRIFRAFQAQQSRRDVNEVYEAYTARLKREGLGAPRRLSMSAGTKRRRRNSGGTAKHEPRPVIALLVFLRRRGLRITQ